jgi:hypothetical protein
MLRYEEMVKKHKEDWKDNASIVGLSIDSWDEAMKHIEINDLKRINHYRFKANMYEAAE